MKRLLLILTLVLTLFLVGCTQCITEENGFCNGAEFTTTITTIAELPRYRVKVVEVITGDDEGEIAYIVSKDGYTIGGIYTLDTEQTFQLNDIIYAVIVDEYTAVPFWEWLEDNKTDENVVLNILDDCDYYLLIVVDRRDCNDGYEYIFQENGQPTPQDEWIYCDELFSINDYVLGIEYNIYDGTNREEFVLYDLE